MKRKAGQRMYSHSKKYKNPQHNKFNQSKQWHAKRKKKLKQNDLWFSALLTHSSACNQINFKEAKKIPRFKKTWWQWSPLWTDKYCLVQCLPPMTLDNCAFRPLFDGEQIL